MTHSVDPAALGCSTVMFSGDLAEKLRAMREAGFTHTEITAGDLYASLQGIEHTLALLADSGLRISAHSLIRDYEGCPESEIAARSSHAAQLLDQAVLVGADVLVMCSNTAPHAIADRARQRDDLRRLGDLAAERGMRIAYEALCWGTHTSDYRDAWRLVEAAAHANVGLLLDSSHIGALGLPNTGIREIDPRKVFHVQVADLPSARLSRIELSRYYRMLPGDGALALDEFRDELRAIGYDGLWSLEVLSDRYRAMPPGVAAKAAHESMSRYLQRPAR